MTFTSSPPEKIPNWLDLPPELTAVILNRLDSFEILKTARKVCVMWRNICNDPSMWKSIDIHSYDAMPYNFRDDTDFVMPDLERMCRHTVDLSCGLLEEIRLDNVFTEHLLHYIADRSPKLRTLRVESCDDIVTKDGFGEVAKKLVNLKELHLFFVTLPTEALKCFGRCCPQLKSLTYNVNGLRSMYMNKVGDDNEALAIAQTMPGLHHLSLHGNQMTNKGLQEILNGCPHLESLDLTHCFSVDLSGDLGKTCAQRIKNLIPPSCFTSKFPLWFNAVSYVMMSNGNDEFLGVW